MRNVTFAEDKTHKANEVGGKSSQNVKLPYKAKQLSVVFPSEGVIYIRCKGLYDVKHGSETLLMHDFHLAACSTLCVFSGVRLSVVLFFCFFCALLKS